VSPMRLRTLPMAVARVARLLQRWQIDVLHTHMFWPNLIGTLAARRASTRVVVTSEHGKNLWKGPLHRWAERHVITPRSDLRVCASEDIRRLREEVDRIPSHKLIYVPNGTDIPPPVARHENAVPVIGSVGRFVEAKDYDTLIAAAARLHGRGVMFRLYLIGDGPQRPQLEQAVHRHGLESVVVFAGYQAEISEWLGRFDVFVLPSIREGQPLALLEAMAHGLAIVASRVGGIPCTVEHGIEAELVEPRDPDAFADALQTLLSDRERRTALGKRARRRVEREFSIQAIALRHAQIYQQLWDRKSEADA
jgi:glycosyltransferase involved in cell wall biosynthesis